MKVELRQNERMDDLHRNGYQIIQNPEKFCFGIDAVLLSGFVHVKSGAKVLDLGTGTGIIPILVEAKTDAGHISALELQEESVDMARRSVMLNNLEEKISIVQGDIKEASHIFEGASFDVVTTNPPYMIGKHGLVNPDLPKAIARHEIYCTLDDVVRESARLLKMSGKFFMVHRPYRLVEIINTLSKYKLEAKRIRFVHPYQDKEPNMVLIEAVKGGKSRVTIEPPLVVYEDVNVYTKEILEIYGYE
ncbi:tRNA1(Val) (adenine(37)-N6)-methyltransferase [[Clostridium] polysaccharolyticum]|uniref:tRNA1(Val) A37 N6-methylase TrmN6 n=1 Tax=[Clostridium] polysaccharolyticum TaxID=29364 RepID=A0A1I0FNI7_9FIRM|nr:tRNA1(Val) (adenine(37)-N6)-methyltransferase [[Clostridium] polysaccharolyticum]SET59806.1 tRNA1(Val) A37 N6-methylase TrmN6 [[Clostridium] polysaccharolyticum]